MRLAIGLITGFLLASGSSVALADVEREGGGDRRARLDAMERKPAPEGLWSHLTQWQGVENAFTEADLQGKVVVVVTWAKWYQPSLRALPILKDLQDRYGSKGLVTIAVHNPRGFSADDAQSRAPELKSWVAFDETSKFRDLLNVDQDPDFYVFDRAGQLRYADVANGSVEEAVKELVGESRAEAERLLERLAEEKRKRDEAFRATNAINQDVDFRVLPDVPVPPVPPEMWVGLQWPKLAVDPNNPTQPPQELAPTQVPVPPAAAMFPPIQPARANRAIVLYFWHPDHPRTHERVMTQMDRLYRAKGRDLIVIGVVSGFNQNNFGGQPDPNADPLRLQQTLLGMITTRRLQHWLTADLANTMLTAVRSDQFNNSSQTVGPYAAVISSDGNLRWRGDPTSSSFDAAVDLVLRIDPGIQMRREAEEEYIRANSP